MSRLSKLGWVTTIVLAAVGGASCGARVTPEAAAGAGNGGTSAGGQSGSTGGSSSVGGAGTAGHVAGAGEGGTSGAGGAGCYLPECPPTVSKCDSTACCHDPCVEGETCGVYWHAGGPTSTSCVCTNGKLDCCTSTPSLPDCHAEQKCHLLPDAASCAQCCKTSYSPGVFDEMFQQARSCLCDGSTCAKECGDADGPCLKTIDAALSDACAACLVEHLGQCKAPATPNAGCFLQCPLSGAGGSQDGGATGAGGSPSPCVGLGFPCMAMSQTQTCSDNGKTVTCHCTKLSPGDPELNWVCM